MTIIECSLATATIIAATINGGTAAAATQAAQAQTPSVNCTAAAVYTIDGVGGVNAAWTRTAKLRCTAPGAWSDGPSQAVWSISKTAKKQLSGSVTFSGIQPPGCAATWPLTGSITHRKNFTVTATDPTGSNQFCVKSITAAVTIQ